MTKSLFFSCALLIYLSSLSGCQKVRIVDGVMDEGQECFEIMLENATLYYQKEAGGFSSIIDTEGNDWISFRRDSIQQYPLNTGDCPTWFSGLMTAVRDILDLVNVKAF
jgi:hypothetical protein